MTGKSGKKCQYLSPWSELPLHLLQLVSSRLRFADYLSFRRVCATWRLAAKQHNPCPDYPLLMIPNRHVGNTHSFVSASDGKRYRLELPKFDKSYFCVGSFHGWLLIRNVYLKHLLFFLNPFTGAQIDLPPWDVTKTVYRVALSAAPTDPNCVVLILSYFYSSFVLFRAGDNEWIKEEGNFRKPEEALFFRGKFYVLCYEKHCADKESSTHSKLAILEPPRHRSFHFVRKFHSYLVDSGDEILLVLQGYKPRKEGGVTDSFYVFRLDLSTSSWIVLESIMDRVLFLGHGSSVSHQATRLGCKGNCIYFIQRQTYTGWWVFDMEDGSITPGVTISGMNVSSNYPMWITPSFI